MGYFEGLTNAAFKVDKEGRRLFFPYGKFGKARLLLTEAAEIAMRQTLKNFYRYVLLVAMPITIGMNAFLHLGVVKFCIISFVLVMPAYVFLEIRSRRHQKVDARITMAESMENSAAGHNFWTLIALTIMSLLFVAAGLWMAIISEGKPFIVGMLCIGFFGLCALGIGRMTWLKWQQRRNTP